MNISFSSRTSKPWRKPFWTTIAVTMLAGTMFSLAAKSSSSKSSSGKSKKAAASEKSEAAAKEKAPKSAPAPEVRASEPISYNFQVRPILASNCFRCHGKDEKSRKGKLRLDVQEAAFEKAIKPGDPAGSELIKRLDSTDPEELMPPPETHLQLKSEEKAILAKWVAEGANYDTHWAFKQLVKPVVPKVISNDDWNRQELDAFVLDQLKAKGIEPAEAASRERWIRRVTMDLTGLPPTLAEIDAFLKDSSKNPYHDVVDRLLANEHYGERMALDWLDVARYADTFGRHEDPDSRNFPFRDWVIRAFNQNLPYDKFIEWQMAGDQIPEPTVDSQIATAFNRMHMQSNEAGSNEEEFRCEHVADRVRTTATAFLGLSFECARCHDHKYDPISMKDYYSMSAFLNNIDELGLNSRFTTAVPTPNMFLYEEGQEATRNKMLAEIEAKEAAIKAESPAAKERFAQWLAAGNKPSASKPTDHIAFEGKLKAGDVVNVANAARPCSFKFKQESIQGPVGQAVFMRGDTKMNIPGAGNFNRTSPFTLSMWLRPGESQTRATLIHRTAGAVDAACRGYELLLVDMKLDFCLAHFWPGDGIRIRSKDPLPVGEWSHLTAVYDGNSKASGLHLFVNGNEVACDVIGDHLVKDILYDPESGDLDPQKVADADLSSDLPIEIGGRRNDAGLINAHLDELKIFDRNLSAPEVKELAGGDASKMDWFDWYAREVDPALKPLRDALAVSRKAECDFSKRLEQLMVMKDSPGPRRKTYVLTRGRFDDHGEEVQPDVPAAILPWPSELAKTRAGFAKWLVDKKNPLTARVAVNRIWQIFFGKGIVPTQEDFGIQGQLPSNPKLLDWLACDFMDNGWDVKRLCRMITLSATYRQSSKPKDLKWLKEDPDNRLLARGPHHRWNAELIRDQMLAVSGLLVKTVGGPSVFPYQPANLWEDSGTQHTYTQDHGAKLYRRSMYSFWRRTLPPPTMTIFDAPSRENCVVRRERTSTPLQALALMNDPQMLECARKLAENMIKIYPKDLESQLKDSFRLLTSRVPSSKEIDALKKIYANALSRYQNDAASAVELLTKNGESPVDSSVSTVELAALTLVQRTLISSPETVAKY